MSRIHVCAAIHGALVCLLTLAAPLAHAVDVPPIPDRPESGLFMDAPAPWRDYLIQARAAERIADPLQRCFAFPDIPANKWPEGHAEAHCRHHYAVLRPTLDEMESLVENGEVAKLEEMFDRSLARHYAKDGFDEAIHDTFNFMLTRSASNERVGRISEAWLQQAPESAYANLARGAYFNGAAWRARGTKYASETLRSAMQRMSELVDQAIPFFEKALAINPKLIPAHTGMIGLGMLDSRPELEARGIRGAEKLDPACLELAAAHMRALEPRWGGSYEEMLVLSSRLSAHVARRPHLAAVMTQPFADRGSMLLDNDQYTVEARDVLDIAASIGSDEGALRNAARVALYPAEGRPERDKALAYLLQEARFHEPGAWGQRMIAWELLGNEPEWSLKYSLAALAIESDNAFGRYLAGAGYRDLQRNEDADREYRIAIEDAGQRHDALRDVASMWLFSGFGLDAEARQAGATRAKPYIDRLRAEYPDDGRARIMEFLHGMATNARVQAEDVNALLREVDRSDPWQARQAERLEAMLEQFEAFKKQNPR